MTCVCHNKIIWLGATVRGAFPKGTLVFDEEIDSLLEIPDIPETRAFRPETFDPTAVIPFIVVQEYRLSRLERTGHSKALYKATRLYLHLLNLATDTPICEITSAEWAATAKKLEGFLKHYLTE